MNKEIKDPIPLITEDQYIRKQSGIGPSSLLISGSSQRLRVPIAPIRRCFWKLAM